MLSKNITVAGINAGLGVALFPFKSNLTFNVETRRVFHTRGNEQWKANFGDIPLYQNFFEGVPAPDIIISSPDCGSGSILRMSRSKKMGDHKKNKSLQEFFQAVQRYYPKFFLFENLDGLFKSFPKEEFKEILRFYRLVEHNCSVSYFGNSQITRKRLVIVGIRKDLPKHVRKYFSKPDLRDTIKTCKKLYGDLKKQKASFGHVREASSLIISIYARRKMSISQIRLEWRSRLKGKKRWYTDGNEKFSTAPGVYRNLANSYPATARKANRQFDHKGRMLTPRQLARIMGVPDAFRIYVDPRRKGYWINKGRTTVTKGMCYEVAEWFYDCLIKSQHIWNSQN